MKILKRKISVIKLTGTCSKCGHYGTVGDFSKVVSEEGVLLCGLCVMGMIGKHPDE